MRKLVTIQKISGTKAIEGADFIELVFIQGWQCVAKKGEFTEGDLCVYFEVDSYLPHDDKRYEFLVKSCYRNNEFMGEGLRVKTATFKGEISQGLALPIDDFPEVLGCGVGEDVTEKLGVRKWEIPEQLTNSGEAIGEKPFNIPTTDEIRIQSMPELLDSFKGKPYYITTKMDGTSCTIYVKDGKVGVCGRNYEYKDNASNCSMWKFVHDTKLDERLLTHCNNMAIQGEFCGPGIQKNRLKLNKPQLYVFDVMKLNDNGTVTKYGFNDIYAFCVKVGLEMVPVEEVKDSFEYTLEELLERARGKYESGLDKEGIVIRTQEYGRDGSQKMSFKVINNDFLKKEKE